MFESVTATLLNRLLGSYVREECFAPELIDASVWRGVAPSKQLP